MWYTMKVTHFVFRIDFCNLKLWHSPWPFYYHRQFVDSFAEDFLFQFGTSKHFFADLRALSLESEASPDLGVRNSNAALLVHSRMNNELCTQLQREKELINIWIFMTLTLPNHPEKSHELQTAGLEVLKLLNFKLKLQNWTSGLNFKSVLLQFSPVLSSPLPPSHSRIGAIALFAFALMIGKTNLGLRKFKGAHFFVAKRESHFDLDCVRGGFNTEYEI